MGLKDLFAKHPKELVMHAVVVIEKLSPRITDAEKSVRQALALLLRSAVLPILPQVRDFDSSRGEDPFRHTDRFRSARGVGYGQENILHRQD